MNSALNSITACGDAGCAICITSGTGQCKSCLPGYILNSSSNCEASDPNCKERLDSNNCVACVENYYLTTTFTCSKCPDNCATCADYNGCTACEEGYYGGSPITSCTICPSNYKTCVSGSSLTLTCNLGYFQTTNGAGSKICSQCQTTCTHAKCGVSAGQGCQDSAGCKSGSYFDSAKYTCEECAVGAQTCTSSATSAPINNYYLVTGGTPDIVSASRGCTSSSADTGCIACDNAKNFYLSSNACNRCSEGCTSCSSSGCASNGCSTKFRHNSTDNTCEPCPYNCNTCTTSASYCDASGCETNYWRNESTKLCEACTQGCNSTCADTTGCPSANSGWILKSGQTNCTTCPSGCSVCTESGSCSTCKSGYYKDGTGTCNFCPAGCICTDYTSNLNPVGCTSCTTDSGFYYSSNTCVACELNCLACSDATTCTKCDNVNNYYLSSANCVTCGEGCTTCSDSNSGCTTVTEGYMIISLIAHKCTDVGASQCTTNVASASVCLANYYHIASLDCTQCPFGCENTCQTTIGCPASGNFVLDGWFFTNAGGGVNSVTACPSNLNCKTCSNVSTCSTCMTSNFY